MFNKMTIAATFMAASSFVQVAQAQELPSLNELASNLLSAALSSTIAEVQHGLETTVIEAGKAVLTDSGRQEVTADNETPANHESEGHIE